MSVSSLHDQICLKCHTEITHCACWSLSGGGGGLLVCQLQNPSLATEKESRLLLYQNLESDLDNLSCTEKLAKAQFASKNPVWMQYCCQNISILLSVWSFLTDSSPPPPAVSLSAEEHNQTIPHQFSPTAWKVVYADRYTCQVKICRVGLVWMFDPCRCEKSKFANQKFPVFPKIKVNKEWHIY